MYLKEEELGSQKVGIHVLIQGTTWMERLLGEDMKKVGEFEDLEEEHLLWGESQTEEKDYCK